MVSEVTPTEKVLPDPSTCIPLLLAILSGAGSQPWLALPPSALQAEGLSLYTCVQGWGEASSTYLSLATLRTE